MRISCVPVAVRAGVNKTAMLFPGGITLPLPVHIRRLMPSPKQQCRILVALVVSIVVLSQLLMRWSRHHAPFTVPESRLVIHGSYIDKLPEQLYPLDPFPYSPHDFADETPQPWPRSWLAAVICAAPDAQARMRIRSTWMHLYRDVPFDGRFVVANPGPRWTEMVAMENKTFGDMIVLDSIQEDDVTANTVKTLEFYKYLLDNNMRYEFVTKLDTDSWLNARGFWDRFLSPRLSNDTGRFEATVARTVIGELYYSSGRDLIFPNGSMYTITWDLISIFVALQRKFSVIMGEDMTFSILLLKGKQLINFVNFRGSEKFDYDDLDSRGDGTPWARTGTHPQSVSHAISSRDAIVIHHLKTEDVWFKVAAAFDEHGVKEIPPPGIERATPLLMLWFDFWHAVGFHGIWRDRFDDVPEFFWSQVGEDWICDNIFNTGPTKTGYNTAYSV